MHYYDALVGDVFRISERGHPSLTKFKCQKGHFLLGRSTNFKTQFRRFLSQFFSGEGAGLHVALIRTCC